MSHLRFNPPGLWKQNGRAFNHGVVAAPGRTVHLTGQVAWDENSAVVGRGDCAAQTAKSFENVEAVLASVGGTLADIVSLTIFYLDPDDLPAIQQDRAARLPAATAPASILIQVPGLVHPDLLVELVPIAVIPDARYLAPKG